MNKHDDDDELFFSAMRDVRKLPPHNVAETSRQPRAPSSSRRRLPDSGEGEGVAGPDFVRPGTPATVLRDIRRGRIPVVAQLDLHEKDVPSAQRSLLEFLHISRRDRWCAVRVIHGKGRNSPEGKPVLKDKVGEWLRKDDAVLAFTATPPADGGPGALYVLIKKR